ncbi:MAG: hypothetical protein AAGD32_05225 [Planctomycetota bacterium]
MALSQARTNRKILRLSRLLKLPRAHAIGHLELLWMSAHDALRDDVGDAIDVEAAAEWEGEEGEFAAAMIEVGLLDEHDDTLYVHDYYEHLPEMHLKRLLRKVAGAEWLPAKPSTKHVKDHFCCMAAERQPDSSRKSAHQTRPDPTSPISPTGPQGPEPPGEVEPTDEPDIATPEQAAAARSAASDRRDAEPPPDSVPAAIEAFDRWSREPTPRGRGKPLDTAANEHREIVRLCETLAHRPPIPHGDAQVRPDRLIPQAVDRLIARGKSDGKPPFRRPNFAVGCVRNELDDWNNGIDLQPRAGPGSYADDRRQRANATNETVKQRLKAKREQTHDRRAS